MSDPRSQNSFELEGMTVDERSKRRLMRLLHPGDGKDLLEGLDSEARSLVVRVADDIVSEARSVEVEDAWDQDQIASSYWILYLSGVDQEDEVALAKELLLWSAVFAKNSARVACIQSSERALFKFGTQYFGLKSWPTLVFSDRPDMADFLAIDGHLLTSLSEKRGGIRRLLTELHARVECGRSISDISTAIGTEKFWQNLKIVYGEAKSFVSVTIKSAGMDIQTKK